MDSERLRRASLGEISSWISDGVLTSTELVASALERCEMLEPALNAFITVDREGALSAAQVVDAEIGRGVHRGPLHGVPVAVKDLFWTRGLRTTAGSRIMADFIPDRDAAAVERLRGAGAVILGKANLPEFAYSPCDQYHPEFGPVRNPWDLNRFPGASSNGSAAAVAAGIVPLALGTDTGGSTRTPASFCGITGFKPTYGLVSMHGVIPLAPSMDHVGLLARSAEDCATMLAAVAGYDSRDQSSAPEAARFAFSSSLAGNLAGVRVGVASGLFSEDVEPDVADAVRTAVDTIVDHGATAISVDLVDITDDVAQALAILKVEASKVHERDLADHPEDLVRDVRSKLEEGQRIPAVEYLRALDARRRVRARIAQALADVDVLLSPTADTTAPLMAPDGRVLEPARYLVAGRPSARIPFSLTGHPAISIPCGFDRRGLPIGLQLAGGLWEDRTVLSVAHAYQAVTDWHLRAPAI